MAKKQQNKAVSPEKYMRTKVRNLPVYKCYINENWQDSGMAHILVARQHTHGTVTFAGILVDIWCRGVVDSFYKVNVDEDDLQSLYDFLADELPMTETDYALVHNVVYGALEWAEDAGITPHKSFDVTRYILDEDDDDSPYMELEFGLDGRYVLCVPNVADEMRYMKILDKNLGAGNYDYISCLDDDDDDDWMPEFPFNTGVGGEYQYQGVRPEPKDFSKLNYPWLLKKLEQPLFRMKSKELDEILSLPKEQLKSDLEDIILGTIGMAWHDIETGTGLYETISYESLPNAMLLLAEVGDVHSADVVFEVLRQSENFLDFFFGDTMEDYLPPVVYKLLVDRPDRIVQFLKEPGIYEYCRANLFGGYIDECVTTGPDGSREALYNMTIEILEYYLAHVDDPLIWSGPAVGLMMSSSMYLNDRRLLPLYEKLYATGAVDESACGTLQGIERDLSSAKPFGVAPLDIYKWQEFFDVKWGRQYEKTTSNLQE